MSKAGLPVNAGIDSDDSCRFAYEANNDATFINADIRNLTPAEVSDLYPKNHLKILAGCAPCQPFSNHTQKNKNRENDEKWGLLYSFRKIIIAVQPEIVSMENVSQIMRHKVFFDFVDMLKENGYHLFWEAVFCPDYGIPQTRTRLVLLASKLGEISLIPKTHKPADYVTVHDAIGALPPIEDGQVFESDSLHRTPKLSEINKERIRQSKPGGTWRDWDDSLVAPCHKRKTGKTYCSVYARMEWAKPSPTITTQFYGYGTGRFGHPEQDRALSFREGAILQTFPEKYKFIDGKTPFSGRTVGIHIGNAVPVQLGMVIGKSILKHLGVYGE